MGKSRYPRRGQRIAPATLREALEEEVPATYLQEWEGPRPRLCDLDESAWDRFSEEACRGLANEVVHAVGRAARMPLSIADQHLPALPPGLKVTDLDLEVRTLNCLIAAGLHERPQDLRAMTIEGILTLRGFWVKCLVDLLTSLEYVIDHPGARRALRTRPSGSLKTPRSTSHYPRPGHILAPQTLQPILADPIPPEMIQGTPLEGKRLCDLDEKTWDLCSPSLVTTLADLIVARVNTGVSSRLVRERHLPTPPTGMRLEDLQLENRTFNCLRREGYARHPDELGKRTVDDLLSVQAFGAKCLVDLLSSLETLIARGGRLDARLTAEAEALGAIAEVGRVSFGDPRLGPMLRAIDSEADTVAELAEHILRRRLDPPDPLKLYEQISAVRSRVEQLLAMTLEDELIDIFSPVHSGRDKQIVAEYYGWDGGGGHTLEELGQKYSLSRERIRQVCVRAVKRNRRVPVFAPVMDRALAFLVQRVPGPADTIQQEFDQAGFSACRLPLESVREAARFLSREPGFTLVTVGQSRLAVRPQDVHLPRSIIQVAKRAVLSFGATTIADVAQELAAQAAAPVDPRLIHATLQTLPDFRWLEESRGWFQLETLPQYGLPNMIEKVLSVTGEIDVARLRAAVARYRRTGRKVPPPRVLLEFCRQMPGVRVDGSLIAADPPRDWRDVLGGVETTMVQVLKEHGPVMERGEFEERCIAAGVNRFSFNAIIMCSPVITQFGRSVYGLLGSKPDRRTIQELSARRSATPPSRVLRGYGQTEDGQVYLTYQLSKAAISGGVITVPSALKELVRGRFTIRTHDGREAGTLVSKNGCAWGLGPVLRGHGAEPGDHVVIVFNPAERVATVHIEVDDEEGETPS